MTSPNKTPMTAQPTPRVIHYIREAGGDPDAVLSRTRSASVHRARMAVIMRLRADRFTTGQIAIWLGRHQSSISVASRGGKGRP